MEPQHRSQLGVAVGPLLYQTRPAQGENISKIVACRRLWRVAGSIWEWPQMQHSACKTGTRKTPRGGDRLAFTAVGARGPPPPNILHTSLYSSLAARGGLQGQGRLKRSFFAFAQPQAQAENVRLHLLAKSIKRSNLVWYRNCPSASVVPNKTIFSFERLLVVVLPHRNIHTDTH